MRELQAINPALTIFVAPAGYGKSTIAESYITSRGGALRIDCTGLRSADAFARAIVGAIATTSGGVAQGLSMQVVATSGVPSAMVDLLADAWAIASADLFFFDNAEALADRPAVVKLLNELLERPRGRRHIIIASRVELPLRSARFAQPSETRLIAEHELRFDRDEIDLAFGGRLDAAALHYVERSTQGWPVAVVLWSARAESVDLVSLERDGRSFASADLSGYLTREVLAYVDDALRDTLALCAAAEPIGSDDIAALETLIGATGLRRRLRATPLVTANVDGELMMHPLLRAVVGANDAGRGRELTALVAAAHAVSGRAIRAAQLYQAIGDDARAAEVLGTEATFLVTEVSSELAQVIAALPRETLLEYPSLWNAGTLGRAFLISQEQWREEASRVWATVDATTHAMVRAGCFSSLANVHINAGDFAKARALVAEYESRATEADGAVASVLAVLWRAAADGYEGRDVDIAAAEQQLSMLLAVASTNALWLYSVVVRHHRLTGDRDAELVAIDRSLEAAEHCGLPLVKGLCTIEGAFGAWLRADDERFHRLVDTLERSKRRGSEKGVSFFIACARGDLDARPAFEVYVHRAYAYLVLAERVLQADGADEALTVVRHAVIAADLSGQRFVRIFARVVLVLLRPDAFDEARRVVDPLLDDLCPGEFKSASVAWLAQADVTPFEAFGVLKRFADSAVDRVTVWLSVGAVTLGTTDVALSPRERELMCYLAAIRRPATQDEILDVVFGDDSPASRNQLKVYVSRIRKRLGAHAITTYEFGYGLGKDVAIDVVEIDALLPTLPSRISAKLSALSDRIARIGTGHVANWPWYVPFENAIVATVASLNSTLARSYLALGDERRAAVYGSRADRASTERSTS